LGFDPLRLWRDLGLFVSPLVQQLQFLAHLAGFSGDYVDCFAGILPVEGHKKELAWYVAYFYNHLLYFANYPLWARGGFKSH
jgi:hypothetical protein